MDINLNITATELCDALNNLCSALVASVEQSAPTRKVRVTKVAEAVAEPILEPVPMVEPTEKVVQALSVITLIAEVDPTSELLELRAKLAALKSPANDIKFREFLAKIGVKKLTAVPAGKYAELRTFIESEMS